MTREYSGPYVLSFVDRKFMRRVISFLEILYETAPCPGAAKKTAVFQAQNFEATYLPAKRPRVGTRSVHCSGLEVELVDLAISGHA